MFQLRRDTLVAVALCSGRLTLLACHEECNPVAIGSAATRESSSQGLTGAISGTVTTYREPVRSSLPKGSRRRPVPLALWNDV
jgi:hypothetical protein